MQSLRWVPQLVNMVPLTADSSSLDTDHKHTELSFGPIRRQQRSNVAFVAFHVSSHSASTVLPFADMAFTLPPAGALMPVKSRASAWPAPAEQSAEFTLSVCGDEAPAFSWREDWLGRWTVAGRVTHG